MSFDILRVLDWHLTKKASAISFGKIMHCNGKIVPSFVTFSPELLNNIPATVLPVFGPPRVGPLGVW